MYVKIDISPGELLDRLSILNIKLNNIKEKDKLINVTHEHSILTDSYFKMLRSFENELVSNLSELYKILEETNKRIWDIEDKIRDHERLGDFTTSFITLARGVYKNNDFRSKIKREINLLCQSEIIEEKSYSQY